MSDQPITKTST